jgi:ABC-type proline/glycine betaine transport system ATPase subunit
MSRVAGLTLLAPFITREMVAIDSPVSLATSRIAIMKDGVIVQTGVC